MSSIYVQEPPTNGKVLLKTSAGDLDIELWSKEAPKACRNFVQLCLEGYYNGTIFHRVVKGFIVQGGDPTGTGTGGESIYGAPFKDEIHSRLRFVRRGLLAMANAGKDDNGSQFFFTMGATPELQGKHTVFAKVSGDTLYNMLKLEDGLVDIDDRPQYPHKILSAEVLNNPFDDIVPRCLPKSERPNEELKKKPKTKGVKDYKLLSFGEEAEEDEEEAVEASKAFAGRSKSSHDVLDDPKLSSQPAVDNTNSKNSSESSDTDSDETRKRVERIRSKLKKSDGPAKKKSKLDEEEINEEEFEEYDFDKERKIEQQRKVDEIRKEIRDLKKDYKSSKVKKEQETQEEEARVAKESSTLSDYRNDIKVYKAKQSDHPKKGQSREEFTLKLLSKFKNKLHSAKEKLDDDSDKSDEDAKTEDKSKDDDDLSEDNWLAHKLKFDTNDPLLAKDANMKGDDWFEISDPRNALNKRRREASKELLQKLEKRYRQ